MSFHITLPSNSPTHITNTQSDFTTFLNDKIHLKGDYEVALSEITFSSNYILKLGTLHILTFIDDKPFNVKINVEIPNGFSLNNFVSFLNYKFDQECDYRKYLLKHKLDDEISTKKDFLINTFDRHSHHFNVHDNKITIKSNILTITKVEGLINQIFKVFDKEITYFESDYLPEKLNIINYIIVYTDIIDFQYFGDKKTQILRSLPVFYHNNEIQTNFDNQHYVKVKDTYISSINIQLRDIWGEPIRLEDFFFFSQYKFTFQTN